MSLVYVGDYERQCAGKQRWPNSHVAKMVARWTMADLGGRALTTYHCPHCCGWHNGHVTAWRKREASRQLQEAV
ncbi:MAG TPA: hypothetical protein VFG00_00465 [Acidothermaceae bacterium]|nr:hypothetical protein [Acidothermaceae bacterium]